MQRLVIDIGLILIWLVCMNQSYQTEVPDVINKLIGVVVIVKEDTKHLVNWIQYHKSLGVDHVFIVDQNSTQPLINDVLPFIRSGYVLTYDFLSTTRDMPWIYDYFMKNYQLNFHYFAFLSPKEYIFLNNFDNLKGVLQTFRSYGQLTLASKDVLHTTKDEKKKCSISREMRGIINTRHLDRDRNGEYHFTGNANAVTTVGLRDDVADTTKTAMWNYISASDPPRDLYTNIYINRYEQPEEDAPTAIHIDKDIRSKLFDCSI
jgi:hypothetical protein